MTLQVAAARQSGSDHEVCILRLIARMNSLKFSFHSIASASRVFSALYILKLMASHGSISLIFRWWLISRQIVPESTCRAFLRFSKKQHLTFWRGTNNLLALSAWPKRLPVRSFALKKPFAPMFAYVPILVSSAGRQSVANEEKKRIRSSVLLTPMKLVRDASLASRLKG